MTDSVTLSDEQLDELTRRLAKELAPKLASDGAPLEEKSSEEIRRGRVTLTT